MSSVMAGCITYRAASYHPRRIRSVAILILPLFCLIHGINGAKSLLSKTKSTCNIGIMDNCAATLFVFGKRGVYFPVNETEMVPHCQEEFDAETCVKSYARKCLEPFPRQIVGVLIHGASQVIHARCKPKGVKEYLSHRDCISRSLNTLHDCMDQLIMGLNEISLKTVEGRIPMACCAFARYQHCSVQSIKNKCPNNSKAADYIGIKMIKGYAGEMLDLACQGLEWEGDKCSKLKVPDGGFVYRDGRIVKNGRQNTTTASLLPPFISIFTKL